MYIFYFLYIDTQSMSTGTALVNNLKNIKDNKNRTRPNIHIDEIYEYDF